MKILKNPTKLVAQQLDNRDPVGLEPDTMFLLTDCTDLLAPLTYQSNESLVMNEIRIDSLLTVHEIRFQ